MTGEVCQRLNRKWYCIELSEEYLKGALGRFKDNLTPKEAANDQANKDKRGVFPYYVVPQPGYFWEQGHDDLLPKSGGKKS